MKMKVVKQKWGSVNWGSLAEGCKQCLKGEKLVIFVTSECNSNCFYCPLSIERKNTFTSYANERPIKKDEDLLIEAELMTAKGASLTGGDPLESHSIEKTLYYSQLLKKEFEEEFHIHCYTRGLDLNENSLKEISKSIDEVRFHVKNPIRDFLVIKKALNYDLDIGIEIPAIPAFKITYYQKIINKFEQLVKNSPKFHFINLNELEISETNFRNILRKKMKPDPKEPSSVLGSAKLAEEIVYWASENSNIPVHYCNLAAKDRVQLPNRLLRIAKNVSLPSDVVIEEGNDKGLLLRGEIKLINSITKKSLKKLREEIITMYSIPKELLTVDFQKSRILTHAAILEEISENLKQTFPKIKIAIIEEYPSYDRLQTTYIPL